MEAALNALVEDRQKREEEIAAERHMLEEERMVPEEEWETERRWFQEERATRGEEMQRQMEALIRLVRESGHGRSELGIKLVLLSEKDDIEAYLITFERIMVVHKVNKERLPHYLVPQLMGRAQLAFAALPTADADD